MMLPCSETWIVATKNHSLAQGKGHATLHKGASHGVRWGGVAEKEITVSNVFQILFPEDRGEGLWPQGFPIFGAVGKGPSSGEGDFRPIDRKLSPERGVAEGRGGVEGKGSSLTHQRNPS